MQRLMKKLFGDLSTARGKLKLVIILTGFLIVVLGITAGAINATQSPQFCSTCHTMQPEYATWKVSAHATEATCVQCHIEPGLKALLTDKVKGLKQVYEVATKTYPQPITMVKELSNEQCEQCHEVNEIQPTGDLKIPHYKHLESGISCVTCHSGVAHGNIADRGLTKDGNFEQWTEAKAKEQMTRVNLLPDMKTCTSCHTERKVANQCATCHQKVASPKSHQSGSWKTAHGPAALSGSDGCSSCHVPDAPLPGNGDKTVALARNTQLCSSCHKQKPENHQASDWMLKHKATVASKGRNTCEVCHGIAKADTGTVSFYCNMCHKF